MTKQGEAIHVCRGHRPAAGVFVAVAMIGLVLTVSGSAEDWTQWRGADRLAVWHETGIVERLPDELEVSWRTPIRSGYSGPAVAGGRVFITDWLEDADSRTLDGTERALALDEQTGSGRPGSLLTLAPHRSGRAGSAASGSSTDGFATRRRAPMSNLLK